MTTERIFQGLLSIVLAAALFLSPALSAHAAQLPETSAPVEVPETTAPQPATEPTETTSVTEPPETTAPTQPEEASTIPESTEAPTIPESTEAPTVPETTEAPETEPTETEPTETIPEPTQLLEVQPVTVLSIAQAWTMPAGTENITIRGTIVFASGTQAVLQDSTGGIRLSFSADPGTVPGEVLQVTGKRSGGFAVEDFESLGIADLPVVESTLLDAPENLRILVKNATLDNNRLSQNGFSISLSATVPEGMAAGDSVNAYGVILDGIFYADSIVPGAASAGTGEQEWNLYFGQLHAHTNISDGLGTVTQAFDYASNVEGLDFFAVTDYSDSLDHAEQGQIAANGADISSQWAEGKAAAAAVTDETFVGIFGYEMCWYEDAGLGHINTFNTPGWQAWGQEGFDTLESYYEALTTVPGSISQLNHPGHAYGNFQLFDHYTPEYDNVLHLLEVGGKEHDYPFSYFTKALDQGWHLAPANNQNNHEGNWGDESAARTVVLAKELTADAIYEAIRSYRVYATEDSDLEIYYQMNGKIMGSILGPENERKISVYLNDPTDESIGTLEVIADGGAVVQMLTVPESHTELNFEVLEEYNYYYLRITQPDGDTAVTAPVWVDSYENLGIRSFASDVEEPMEGQEILLTLELFNQETTAWTLENVEILQNGQIIHEITEPGTVEALSSRTYPISFTWTQPGEVQLTAIVTGTVAGYEVDATEPLTLRYQAKETSVCTIEEVRKGTPGAAYRIKGYVTAGSSNPYNDFSNTLYLQDDTGGIAVMGVPYSNIEVGTPMEITGVLRNRDGNLCLEQTKCVVLEEPYYRYVPRTMTNAVAMDYETHGGELLQVEGTVVSLTKTSNDKGICRLTLQDFRGDLATVVIADEITSGAYGTNDLAAKIKKGRTVRVMGLLHKDEDGKTVLRVRNCDEVVYVPPKADPTNPKTGDGIACAMKFAARIVVPQAAK